MKLSHSGFELILPGRKIKDAPKSMPYTLALLLIGSLSISKNGIVIKQRKNYSDLTMPDQSNTPRNAFEKFRSDYGISVKENTFIKQSILSNRAFYKDLIHEFSNFFIQSHRKCHTSAFVYAYRILERMLYSVPLIYISTERDYYGTFKTLKTFLEESSIGELGLYRKILESGKFIDQTELDLTYSINFSSSPNAANFFNLTDKKYKEFESKDKPNHELTIKFRNIAEMLCTLRNRFFHTRTGDGQANIRADEIIDSDEYFSYLNPIFCSHLSLVCLQLISLEHK